MKDSIKGAPVDLAGIIDAIPDNMSVIDRDFNIVGANDATRNIFGNDIVGKKCFETYQGQKSPCTTCSVHKTFQTGKSHEHKAEVLDSNGKKRQFWCKTGIFRRDENGKPLQVVEILRDITELEAARNESEQYRMQLLQAQKMEAVGQLAGGVAHDFNNMLSVIIGYTYMAIEKMGEDSDAARDLQFVMDAARRSRELTVKLLTFTRSQKTNPIAVTTAGLMKTLKTMFEPGARQKVHMVLDIKNDVLLCVDENQIQQALLNICNNARDAMPDGGVISVEVFAGEITNEKCFVCATELSGKYCRIKISDEGTGMPDEVVSKVLEPFFTTKAMGEGTGLGLSTAMGIIKSHGGHMQIESTPGKGSTIIVYLPLSEGIVCETEIEAPPEAPRKRTGTILVIDDEIPLLKMVQRILEKAGYTVHIADTGLQGVKKFRELGEVDLVLLDMLMPLMDGQDVFNEIRKINPNTRIAVMTGFSPAARTKPMLSQGAVTMISKPFLPAELYQSVDKALK